MRNLFKEFICQVFGCKWKTLTGDLAFYDNAPFKEQRCERCRCFRTVMKNCI